MMENLLWKLCDYIGCAYLLDGTNHKLPNTTVWREEMDERLVSTETVVSCRWGNETVKLGMKQIDKGQISTVKRYQSFECCNPSTEHSAKG